MHHQVQQLGNLGLERLGFDGWIGGRHVCSMHDVESVDIARWFWGSSFSLSVSVSLRFKCSAMAEQQFHAVAGAPLACTGLEPTGAQQSRKHAGAILVDLVTLQFHSRVHFRPSRKELRNPRHWIAPARGFYLLTRRFYCCCDFGMAQCLDDPLRDPPHIVLAHSARGASWRTKAQSTWAQGRARVVRDDLLVRRNANAVERFFRHLPVYIKTRHGIDHEQMIVSAAGN